jgi:hypothetical protein
MIIFFIFEDEPHSEFFLFIAHQLKIFVNSTDHTHGFNYFTEN